MDESAPDFKCHLICTWLSNWMSIYFPNRLELSFFSVLALPKACGEHHSTSVQLQFYWYYVSVNVIRPPGRDWTWAFCPWRCSVKPCSDSWWHNTAESSSRPPSSQLHSHRRWGWSGCWIPPAWFGRRCPPKRSCRGAALWQICCRNLTAKQPD